MSTKMYLVRFGSDNPSNYAGITPTFTKFFNSAGTATTAPGITEIASTGMFGFTYAPQGFIGFILDGTASLASSIRYVSGTLDPNDMVSDIGTSLTAMGASLIAQGATISVIGASLSVMGGSLSTMGGSLNVMGGSLSTIGFSLGIMGGSLSVMGVSLGIMGVSLGVMGGSIAVMGASNSARGVSLAAMGVTLTGMGNTLSALGFSSIAGWSLIGSAADSFGTSAADPTTIFGFMKRLQEIQEGDSTYGKGTGIWTLSNRGSTTTLRTKTITDSSSSVTKV